MQQLPQEVGLAKIQPEFPGDRLRHDHAQIDALFTELLDQFEEGSQRAVRIAWAALEEGLGGHLEAEERFLLPLFEQVDLREALGLRAEHVAIRRMLAELAVGIDLQLVQRDLARAFIDGLRAHAQREEELLYRWANRRLQRFDLRQVRDSGQTLRPILKKPPISAR
jgi:hemerythrin-like domain-containing protein